MLRFGVTLGYPVAKRELPNLLGDKMMLSRFQALDELEPSERERIVTVIDSLVRDAKARHAYRESA